MAAAPFSVQVMDSFETRFNRQYQYPYLFINDEPFTDEFQATVRRSTRAKVTFDLVPPELWETPKWINRTLVCFSPDNATSWPPQQRQNQTCIMCVVNIRDFIGCRRGKR
jgi:hypothetical protein